VVGVPRPPLPRSSFSFPCIACRVEVPCGHFQAMLKHILSKPCVTTFVTYTPQDLLASGEHSRDASGNPILVDSGVWLRNEIKKHCKDADVKYIDPSYMIRSVPTISADRIYCKACASGGFWEAWCWAQSAPEMGQGSSSRESVQMLNADTLFSCALLCCMSSSAA